MSNKKILIIDDDKDLSKNIKSILEKANYSVSIAKNGVEAIELCEQENFYLALVDIKLDDKPGLELIKEIEKIKPDLEFIIITGYASKDSAKHAVEDKNILAYEEKPLDFDNVLNIMKQAWRRKETEEKLFESKERYKQINKNIQDIIYSVDNEGRLIFVSGAVEKLLGHTPEELIGKSLPEILKTVGVTAPFKSKLERNFQNNVNHKKEEIVYEFPINKKGSKLYAECREKCNYDAEGNFLGCSGVLRDITSRKLTEQKLAKAKKRFKDMWKLFRTMSDNMTDMLWAKDVDKKYIYANKSICDNLLNARNTEEPIGKNDMFFAKREREKHPKDPEWHTFGEVCRDSDQIILDTKKAGRFGEYGNVKGKFLYLDVLKSPIFNDENEIVGIVGSARDVTQEKAIQKELEKRERILSTIASLSEQMAIETDFCRSINNALEKLGAETEVSRSYIFRIHEDKNGQMLSSQYSEWTDKGITPQIDNPALQNIPLVKSGFTRWKEKLQNREIIHGAIKNFPVAEKQFLKSQDIISIAIVPIFLQNDLWGFIGFDDCKKERKWSVGELEALKAASGAIGGAIRRNQYVSSLEESERRYRELFETSRDGFVFVDKNGKIINANKSYCKMLGYTLDELKQKDNFYQITPEKWRQWEKKEIWENKLLKEGYSGIYEKEYITKDGTIFPVELQSYAVFDEEKNPLYLWGVVRDISNRRKTEQKLNKAFEGTIEVISDILEVRDAYTAGHQRRVSQLTSKIANELNMPKINKKGLEVAASIHDLGKIVVPAQILSKPSKLSELEFASIKQHPVVGYKILKGIEFPWPLAEIVYQHHERLDGSGYPRGLKDNEIMLEARILAVADVVEAMSSQRPYRPALGMEAALEEIEKNKEEKFDAEVVKACKKIINKGFEFMEVEGTVLESHQKV